MALADIMGKGFSSGAVMDGLYKFGIIVVVGLVLLFGAWIVIYFMKYNKSILLIEEINGQIRFEKDKGFRNKKARKFEALKHRNYEYAYPMSRDEFPSGRGTIIPFIVRNQQAVPIKGVSENPLFIPADLNMFNHLVGRVKMNEELTRGKQNFWDKYGRDILLVTMMTILFLSIIFILKRVDMAIEMGQKWSDIGASASRQIIQ